MPAVPAALLACAAVSALAFPTNAEPQRLLQIGLTLFSKHQARAEHLALELR